MAGFGRKKQKHYSEFFDADSVNYYRLRPTEFVYDFIYHQHSKFNGGEYEVTSQQQDLFQSVVENKKTTVRSGRGCGKTTGVAQLAPWWMCMNPENTKVIYTAPSYGTLKIALWPEIAKWIEISLIKDLFTYTEEQIYLTEKRKVCFGSPRTAKDKESFSGIHDTNLLIVVDEASGVSDEILRMLEATLTSGENNKIVLISNPTKTVGFFYDTHTKPFTAKTWSRLRFSALDSPLVDQDTLEQKKLEFGEDHPLYLVDCLGEFPEGNTDSFISLAEVQNAIDRDDVIPNGEIELGVDVARFGDDLTVIYWRHGFKVYPAIKASKNSITDTARLVLTTIEGIRIKTGYEKTIRVKVDDTGVGGGVTDILKEDRSHNIEVIPCNNGGKGNDKYQNEASIMWGKLKDNINIISLPPDDRLREEVSSRRWGISASGKIIIEPKKDYKKDFQKSPDYADALILCFAEKANERVIVKNFDPLDTDVVKQLSYMGEDRYCSTFYSKDNVASILYSAWDNFRLYVYDNFVSENPIPFVATNIASHYPLRKIIGNERMFDKKSEDLSSKFRKFKIHIHENYNYNEAVAIDNLISMINQKRIVISPLCKNLIDQLRDWKMDLSKMEIERSYGLCYALCNLVSEIKTRAKSNIIIPNKPSILQGYSYNIPKQNKGTSWMVIT